MGAMVPHAGMRRTTAAGARCWSPRLSAGYHGRSREVRAVEHTEHGPTDEALARLEDVLLELPFERAVPDLPELLSRAEVDRSLLLHDERAMKLLHEALVARPFGTLEVVQRVRTEVELLTLEVELLTERLADADAREQQRIGSRLDAVRSRLEELRAQL
jgi:hypothetical protein